MEFTEADQWPRNAIKVLDFILNSQQNVADFLQDRGTNTAWEYISQNKVYVRSGLAVLQELHNSLHKLAELHTTYNCRLTLNEFKRENIESLAYRFAEWPCLASCTISVEIFVV